MLCFSIPSREEGGLGGCSAVAGSSRYGLSNSQGNTRGSLLISRLRGGASVLAKPVAPPTSYRALFSGGPFNYVGPEPLDSWGGFSLSSLGLPSSLGASWAAGGSGSAMPFGPPVAGSVGYFALRRLEQAKAFTTFTSPLGDEASSAYQQGLDAAHELRQSALAASTISRQNKAAGELWGWLNRYAPGTTPSTCSDADLAAYVMQGWLPSHRSRDSPESAAGPSALKAHLSALSGFFSRIDRGGPYVPTTRGGNPCESSIIEDLRVAYQREHVKAGYVEVSAVPMTEAKYRALAFYLWAQACAAASTLDRLVALRDHLCVLLLWQTALRGHDVGKLGLGDFVDPLNPSLPFLGFPLTPPWLWGAYLGPVLCIRERGTKTFKLARAPPIFLTPDLSEPRLSIPRALALYLSLCSASDAPPGSHVTDVLFRPLTPDRCGFKDAPLSSSTLGARLRLHLLNAGLYEGETVHSFRRGTLQSAQSAGLAGAALMGFGQLRTEAVLERYLDRNRHQGREVRARL